MDIRGYGKAVTDSMKRTAKYETLPLNRGKTRLLLVLLNAFAEMKDSVLRILGRSVAWDNLDHPKKFRDSLKSSYKPGNPVHLLDQAVFDAVDTLRRFIEAGLTSNHIKTRIFVQLERRIATGAARGCLGGLGCYKWPLNSRRKIAGFAPMHEVNQTGVHIPFRTGIVKWLIRGN